MSSKPRPAPPGGVSAVAHTLTANDAAPLTLSVAEHSVDEAARLTGLSRDLLYDEMRRGNLASVKVGRRRLITRQHLQQFPGIAS
jgi:excisionase family DNA binding protein